MIAPDPTPSGLEIWDKLLICAMLICALPILAQLASAGARYALEIPQP